MEAFVVNSSKLVSDVIAYIAELKNTFHSERQPINDDNVTLQKFCVKLETILRHEQKEKYTLLGIRKDYWNFITDVITKDDGVKYVNTIPQMKTAQGKGRCFIRYALVKQTLADTIQRLTVSGSSLVSWYRGESILRNLSLSTALITKLYDLNDVEFDLPCAGYDLDISWPAFSRKTGKEGSTSARRGSISSINSVDFRNERRDPVLDLASEVASLMEFFETEVLIAPREGKPKYDNISLTSVSETPTINELALQVSGIHKRALQWKADIVNERATTATSLRKAQDDRQFAIQESELKTKQLMEKFNNLAKTASEENEKKISVLTESLSTAEASLIERDLELRTMREEVNKSVFSTSNAHKSAIDLEKQLMASERKRNELESEVEALKYKIQTNQQSEGEFTDKEKRLKERVAVYEEKEIEFKDNISELKGNLKAKEVALENIQASFEKLTGMVFGSFQELESNMKEKLVDKEQGLQNQTLVNRKLELQVADLQRQLKEANSALKDFKSQLSDMEKSREDAKSSNLELQQLIKDRDESLTLFTTFVKELKDEFDGKAHFEDDKFVSINNKQEVQEYFQKLLSYVKDSKVKLTQAQGRNSANEKILADRQEDIQRLSERIEQHNQLLDTLRSQAEEKQNAIDSLTKILEEANSEIIRLNKNEENVESTVNSLSEKLKLLSDEKSSMEAQEIIDKQQLETANEGRIRAECAQIKAEEDLKNLKCVMEQEVAALKFQLSSETMRFEEEIKVFSEQNRENVVNKERCLSLEDTIADLESSLKERTNEWESEKRKYVNEIKRLRSQVQLLNNALEGNKQKMTSLENDLILTTKQLEEERTRQKDLKNLLQDVEKRKTDSEKQLLVKINEMGDDMKDLKAKIVSLTREKANLWVKAAEFEHELKLKASERWVQDNEVNKCSSCKAEFSFLLRKHHCRLCGRIFCHSCSNNMVKTAHSSKLKRVCNGCLAKDQRLSPQHRNTDSEDFDETMSDVSFGTSPRKNTTSSVDVSDDEQEPSTSKPITNKQNDNKNTPPNAKSKKARSVIIHESGNNEIKDSFGSYEDFSKDHEEKATVVDSRDVVSPDGDDYEFIDQNEEIGELPESRIVVNDSDLKEELVIPAVNDEDGISRDFTVSPGIRYIIPVIVATPGASLCWSFKTVYKSIIFGLAYKPSESISDSDIETLYPLARFSSNVTPVEGEWKTSSHGVYILVFDNSFSRFTSKQTSCVIHVKRRPSILKTS